MKQIVILDTNIVYSDLYLSGPDIKKLLELTDEFDYNIGILHFIYDEIVKKYMDQLEKDFIEPFFKAKSKAGNFKVDHLINYEATKDDLKDLMKTKYENFLENFIKNHDIKIIDYSHDMDGIKKLSDKYFQKIRPFGSGKKEKDFTDVIISQELVKFANDNEDIEKIFFISKNHTDFTNYSNDNINSEDGSPLKLHSEITDDLIEEEKIVYFPSIDNLIKYLDSLREQMEYIQEEKDQITLFLKNELKEILFKSGKLYEIEENLDGYLSQYTIDGNYIIGGWYTDVSIENSENLSEVDIIDLQIENNTTYKVYGELSGSLDFNYGVEALNPTFERGDAPSFEYISEYVGTDYIEMKNIFEIELEKREDEDDFVFEVISLEIGNTNFY